MNIYFNNELKGNINLYDTYKLQIIDIKKLDLFCFSGYNYKFTFELTDFYKGKKYPNEVAISEIELTGKRFQY